MTGGGERGPRGSAAPQRSTPLATLLADMIRRSGPMPVSDFMRLCLQHPAHGYYVAQRALGRFGDFITAPEISQVFGELIGLWAVVVWQQMGSPKRVLLTEAGPGRGTLMADALRAARRVPGFVEAADVRLIEISPVLRQLQDETLGDVGVALLRPAQWHTALVDLPTEVPLILIANEFLDTFPVDQYIQTPSGIAVRALAVDDAGQFAFTSLPLDGAPPPAVAARLATAPPGAIAETTGNLGDLMVTLAGWREVGLSALFIDYGHEASAIGDTLQAVRGHRYEDVLASPGEADLSAQVDFEAVATAAREQGLAVDGPTPQATFLGRLGAVERVSRLMEANPTNAGDLEAGVMRLMAPQGMGTRFKAIGIRSPGVDPLPGLDPFQDLAPDTPQ